MYLYRLWVAKYNSNGSNIIIAKFNPLMEILLIAKKNLFHSIRSTLSQSLVKIEFIL